MPDVLGVDLPGRWEVGDDLVERLRQELAPLADEAVRAIVAEVPAYARLSSRDGGVLRQAVHVALGLFLTLAARQADASVPVAPSASGAYDLGRGEARAGRSLDALLAAYRIGARVSWRRLSRVAAEEGMPAPTVGAFAELVFAYIDALTASSVSGYSDETAKTGRARERYRDRLTTLLLAGADDAELEAACERAVWAPPESLTAVVLPSAAAAGVQVALDERTLTAGGEAAGLGDQHRVLLIPDLRPAARARLRRALSGSGACLGPERPWRQARASLHRACSGERLRRRPGECIDTDERLVDLVLGADPDAHAELRERALAPLAGVRPSTREAIEDTLRSWLLHQGRRADVAADLHVHPQTVRYRMGVARQHFGAALDDPGAVLALVVALGAAPGAALTPAREPRSGSASGSGT